MTAAGSSWGRYPPATQRVVDLHWRDAALPAFEGTALGYGNGRSYGDSCLNDGGTLLHTRGLDRFINFDATSGVMRCEAGVLLSEILDFALPRGWFVPVSPGTRFITVGGAIANDVHGKNHHRAGTFGEHLRSFELLRSDGARFTCSREQNAELFTATIGGLGLTGIIVWAEFALKRVSCAWMQTHTKRFRSLDEFFALSAQFELDYEYTVAWVDCAAKGRAFGRGVMVGANHAPSAPLNASVPGSGLLNVPFTPPISLVNQASLRAFNALYFHWPRATHASSHYRPYFYPLDAIGNWNRIYGPRGLLQYQCVVPPAGAVENLSELLGAIASSGTGSFLAVLKVFTERAAAGILSFPRAGVTLALDFPNRGAPTFDLLERLDDIVVAAGGAVYPAKDARLKAARFRRYFPQWEKMLPHIDPHFSSGFWRRVTE